MAKPQGETLAQYVNRLNRYDQPLLEYQALVARVKAAEVICRKLVAYETFGIGPLARAWLKESAVPDADGHCTRCGCEFEDPKETAHECPPGFTQ
jgi:hypothetical protein